MVPSSPNELTAAWFALGTIAALTIAAFIWVLKRKGRTEVEARAYLAGVTYVLSGDSDAAIAELSKAARMSTHTLETYFAMGALFRRKGELDRAIRIHSNILLTPSLSSEVRGRALLALGLDYKSSGLKEKAAEAFHQLLKEDPRNPEALLHLRSIAEEMLDWEKAIELQLKWVAIEGRGQDVLSHLLASHARSLPPEQREEARRLLERASELHPSSADVQLALAQALLESSQPSGAEQALRRALELEPELAPRCLDLVRAVFRSPERIEGLFGSLAGSQPDRAHLYDLSLALYWKGDGRSDAALGLLSKVVERRPRFWEARKELGGLLLAQDRAEELKADYQGILDAIGQPGLGFVCRACRQRLAEHAFRCPACGSWDGVAREE